MDLAIAAAISGVLRAIVEGRLGDLAALRQWEIGPLHEILLSVITDADKAVIRNAPYREALGFKGQACTAADLWRHLIENSLFGTPGWAEWHPAIEVLLEQGCLSRRILAASGKNPQPEKIAETYRRLAGCLQSNTPLVP